MASPLDIVLASNSGETRSWIAFACSWVNLWRFFDMGISRILPTV